MDFGVIGISGWFCLWLTSTKSLCRLTLDANPLERIFDVLIFLNRLQGLLKYLSVSGSLKNFIEPGVCHMGTSATGFRTKPVDIDKAVIYWK